MAKRIVNLHKTRKQIEEGFRGTKNSRIGFNLRESLARDRKCGLVV